MRLLVTREDYYAEAMRVLARNGHGALKIGPLCKAIGVTTGSFYHYFEGWDGFVSDLLADWETQQTQRIVALAKASDDPLERSATLKRLVLGVPHDAERAIRAWSHVSPIVEKVQHRVDEERRVALVEVVLGIVPDRERAELLAVMGMSLLIGVQQWRSPVDTTELGRLLDEYEATIFAHAAAVSS